MHIKILGELREQKQGVIFKITEEKSQSNKKEKKERFKHGQWKTPNKMPEPNPSNPIINDLVSIKRENELCSVAVS